MTAAASTRVSFLDEQAKARATDAVRAFESHTSAELVITVRKAARDHREGNLVWGATFGFAALVFLLFYPVDFATTMMPLDVIVAFAIGYGLSWTLPPMRRAAVPLRRRRAAVEEAAKATFVDLGVSRTTGRTGVLVYVAIFEGLVAIVPDLGVTEEARAAALGSRDALESALARSDMTAFAEALEALGPSFAKTMERAEDDVNELPDEVT
jgi:putative membrane protein